MADPQKKGVRPVRLGVVTDRGHIVATPPFRVGAVILSAGSCFMEKGGERVALDIVRNSIYLNASVFAVEGDARENEESGMARGAAAGSSSDMPSAVQAAGALRRAVSGGGSRCGRRGELRERGRRDAAGIEPCPGRHAFGPAVRGEAHAAATAGARGAAVRCGGCSVRHHLGRGAGG